MKTSIKGFLTWSCFTLTPPILHMRTHLQRVSLLVFSFHSPVNHTGSPQDNQAVISKCTFSQFLQYKYMYSSTKAIHTQNDTQKKICKKAIPRKTSANTPQKLNNNKSVINHRCMQLLCTLKPQMKTRRTPNTHTHTVFIIMNRERNVQFCIFSTADSTYTALFMTVELHIWQRDKK